MDYKLFDIILEDVDDWTKKNSVKYAGYNTRCTHRYADCNKHNFGSIEHWNESIDHSIHFDGGIDHCFNQMNILITDSKITMFHLYPTQDFMDRIGVTFTNGKIEISCYFGTHVEELNMYDINMLYMEAESFCNKITLRKNIVENYFEELPRLKMLQYVLDKMNPNKCKHDDDIVIEI